ncbi:MAG TPA: hypothetical protein VMS17_00635 [Gemmataceae bacterium]|nr:hypothetical protein [Gemmataceae bacterium]
MTIEQVRSFHRARPFVPFILHLADGRAIPVVHNEFLAILPPGRIVVANQPDGAFEVVDLLLVTSIAVAAPAPPQGNGQQSQ